MSNTKRSFSEFLNKEEFPFDIKNGVMVFPTIYSKANHSDNIRFWEIYAIMQINNNKVNIIKSLFDLNNFKKLMVKSNNNISIYIYNKYGLIDGKHTITTPTIIDSGKNIGKTNETTMLTQSLIFMRTLYLKKIKSGYTLNKQDVNNATLIYPMALQTYDKFKDRILYPCYVQPKLDGIRCIISYNFKENKVTILSRRLHELYGFEHLHEEVKKLLGYDDELILDGELYNHDMNLQQISGIVRNENTQNTDKLNLKFYIFDFIDLKNKVSFQDRLTLLNTKFNEPHHLKYLYLTPTHIINNENDGNNLYKSYLKNKYEGIVYKNTNALYEYSNIKEKRSYNYLKRKNHEEIEFQIENYTEGRGSNKGLIVFIMKTKTGKLFNVVPNATQIQRKEMYDIAKQDFQNQYYNKWATISFDDYSTDGTPLRAKFITIRPDYL
jgi:hypothetical protein